MFRRLRTYFLAGLVVVLPVAITIWLFWFVTGLIDSWVLPLLPETLQPGPLLAGLIQILGFETSPNAAPQAIRGFGLIVFIIATVFVGWMTMGFLGVTLMRWLEGLVDRMPVVRSVYNGLKQLIETALAQRENAFDKACLIEYPRKGIWVIAFISSKAQGPIKDHLPDDEILSVFVPTTPNPTSGFLLFVPARDALILDMSIEDAAKLVISAGLVYPNQEPSKTP